MHTQNFDEIKNIFKKSRDKNRPPENDTQLEDEPIDEGISQTTDSIKQF